MAYDVSVIVPIYNMERFVEAGVNALLKQTDVAMEAIFVDDGSKDGGAALLERLIAGHDNLRLIRTENHGSGPARNTGIAAATGEYLYFFDIDDSMEPDALARMVAAARESACDLLVFGFTRRYGEAEAPKPVVLRAATLDGADARAHYDRHMEGDLCIQGAPWNKLFRRDVTVENKVEYPALRRNQDEVFIMRYMAYARNIRLLPDVLYHHLANTQERMWLKYRLEYDENVEELFDFYDGIVLAWNPTNDEVKRILGRLYFRCSLDAMKVLFNPKWKLRSGERLARLQSQLSRYRSRAAKYHVEPLDERLAASNFYPYLRSGPAWRLYAALWLRTRTRSLARR